MARSMTGYGRESAVVDGKEILCEVKSVNSRYLDCTVKAPRAYGYLEERAKSYLSAKGVSRGKVDLFIGINVIEDNETKVALDRAYAGSYIEALKALRDEFALRDDISVMSVARNPEIFAVSHSEEDAEAVWAQVRPVLDRCIDSFIAGREAEGKRLTDDLMAKKEELASLASKVEERAAQYTENYRLKLEARLKEVLDSYKVELDPQRVLTECAIYADRTAIDEELVRLRSHFNTYDEIFASSEPVGRKLDFLLQEMNRETNTIGSKCSDTDTSKIVVEMKCLLEKIREQIQNLE